MPRTFEIRSPKHGVFTVFVDDEDYDRVQQAGPWCIKAPWKGSGTHYVRRHVPGSGYKGRKEGLHNFILGGVKGVDHVNGNGLDNRRANLRAVTQSQNSQNLKLRSDNSSGHRGVSWNKLRNKWYAYTRREGIMKGLGFYDDLDEAVRAAKRGRAKYLPFTNEARSAKA